jgi:GWxTD domain-containing protein
MGQRIRFRILLSLLMMSATLCSIAEAQRYTSDSRNYFDYGEQFYSRVVQSADARSLDVRLNMASAMFSFLRADHLAGHNSDGYYAIRDIYIELTERGNSQAIASKNILDTIFVKNFSETTSKTEWHALYQVLPIPELDTARHYVLRMEIRDGILSKLAVRPVTNDLHLRAFRSTATSSDSLSLGLSDITLFDRLGITSSSFAKGTTYPFSRDITGSFSVAVPEAQMHDLMQNANATIIMTELSRISDPDDTAPREVARTQIQGSSLQLDSTWRTSGVDSMIQYAFGSTDTSNVIGGARLATWRFAIPGKSFEQGKYKITANVTNGNLRRSVTNNFSLVWPDMPVSLEDPRDAMNPLVHITTEGEYKDLQKGSRPELIRKLYAFWKRQDPTPGTAFNERMAAFYQRVDYAYFNYANQHALDGTATDRGKIYILYGAPTKIERELLPGEPPVETWTYTNNVHRQFKFTDLGNRGEYKLVDMKDI